MALSADELGIILLSLKVALVSVAFSLPVAIGVAYVLARFEFPGKTLLDAVVHLPLVLPPVVVGFALLVLFGRHGPIGAWLENWFGIVFAFRWTGAALAAAIMGFPLMVRAIRLSFSAIDRRLETVARTLGGSRAWVFLSVTLPLALPGLAALRAARWVVLKPLGSVELLLPSREHKAGPAVLARQGAVGERHDKQVPSSRSVTSEGEDARVPPSLRPRLYAPSHPRGAIITLSPARCQTGRAVGTVVKSLT